MILRTASAKLALFIARRAAASASLSAGTWIAFASITSSNFGACCEKPQRKCRHPWTSCTSIFRRTSGRGVARGCPRLYRTLFVTQHTFPTLWRRSSQRSSVWRMGKRRVWHCIRQICLGGLGQSFIGRSQSCSIFLLQCSSPRPSTKCSCCPYTRERAAVRTPNPTVRLASSTPSRGGTPTASTIGWNRTRCASVLSVRLGFGRAIGWRTMYVFSKLCLTGLLLPNSPCTQCSSICLRPTTL